MNGTHHVGGSARNGLGDEYHFSDNEDESDDAPDDGLGDYSARFDELMSDGEEEEGRGHGEGADEDDEDDEDDEGGFVYSGVDADPTGGYREQLRDVLGPDHEEDELEEEQEVERSLVHEVEENEKFAATIEDEAGVSLVHVLRVLLHRPAGMTVCVSILSLVYCGHCSSAPSVSRAEICWMTCTAHVRHLASCVHSAPVS
ncbi:hypothetical protein C8Q80DRAFT_1184629 [Daedaleopsis nitida]|nr:hypothetical protein C8Q80DRAFT_1184629 [Daedaleopsis nitida]